MWLIKFNLHPCHTERVKHAKVYLLDSLQFANASVEMTEVTLHFPCLPK